MFNIKSARFFQGTAENLMAQMKNFCVFDTKHLMKNERAIEAPTLKWIQFFRTPWANSVEVILFVCALITVQCDPKYIKRKIEKLKFYFE